MLDFIIRGGDVVTPQGVTQCDVAIAGETIAAIAAPDTLPTQSAGRVIDANGRIACRAASTRTASALRVDQT